MQIASMASMMAELAKTGEELSNAIGSTHQNIAFEQGQGRQVDSFESEAVRLMKAKEKIETRLKAKNEELQKIILINEMFQ